MKTYFRSLFFIVSVCLAAAGTILPAYAEDIDIFIGDSSGGADNPNVLVILDNSSNWSAANQGWPTDANPPVACGNDCNKQGYYELKSLRKVVNSLPVDASGNGKVNLGLMMFNNSNAPRDGGYMRSAIKEMSATNKAAFIAELDKIILNFNTETAASSVQYSAALFDAFKYFGGYTDVAHATANSRPAVAPDFNGVRIFSRRYWGSNNVDINPDGSLKRDRNAYDDFSDEFPNGLRYNSPTQTTCGKNYIIFIGNGFPASENSNLDMREALKYLNDAANPLTTIIEYPVANYSCAGTWTDTGSCYTNLDACNTAKPGDSPTTLYQCVKSSCTGNQRIVQQCTSVTATYTEPSANAANRFADEFTDFLYKTDVNETTGKQNVYTYTIDVYKNQPSLDQSALLRNMAKFGNGQYYSATDEAKIFNAMQEIFAEITSVNSTFASASLPVNATNRTQNENQVFIAMFRPDSQAKPRWFGNLKRYQLIDDAGNIELGDLNGNVAVNTQTGFIKDCATSYWTSDSGEYWKDYVVPESTLNACTNIGVGKYSDLPDGPRVEAGSVAEVIRKGNNPTATDISPTWDVNRNIFATSSVASTTMERLETLATLPTIVPNLKQWVLGYDVGSDLALGYAKENAIGDKETRASIHGDVVHSRPFPVNYGDGNVVVYYGANDGMFRAVDANTGKEKWAFLPYEFNARMQRLQDNQPKISYPNVSTSLIPTPIPKDYFWDGTVGLYQEADSSSVTIYPTMRRGGRMIYALDVTDANTPAIKWKIGCPNLNDDAGCIGGHPEIGQTWSTPNVAFIKGYSTSTPVLVVGGGYDKCEDENTTTPACSGAKGKGIYVLDGETGAVLAKFDTLRSVAADISLIDVDNDTYVDFAYAVDTGGNIYRINFIDPATKAVLSSGSWASNRIAYTNGGGRKFLFPPALLQASGGKVYLALGSGDREHPLISDYPYQDVVNRFYVFMDDISDTAAYNLDDSGSMFDYTSSSTCSSEKVLPSSGMKGWFMNLNQNGRGEQAVGTALIVSGMVTFGTNRPVPTTDGSCSTVLGEARGYWVNLFNGSGAIGVDGSCGGDRSSIFLGGGLPVSPVMATVPINGVITTVVIAAPDKAGTGSGSGTGSGVSATSSQYDPQKVKPLISSKRKIKYWKSSGDK